MRLDRFISQSSGLSRSRVRSLLQRGAVRVDGEAVRDAARQVDADNRIEVDGEVLVPPGHRYYMLNKPAGVVCATEDGRHRTVIALLDEPRREALHPVGRLDIDTTGLLLITDDGQWSHGITAPRRHKEKRYLATLAEPLADSAVAQFAAGMSLQGEEKPTLPAALEILAPTRARVTLQEGRYHQVKRMFAALGNRVVALHREAVGSLQLDESLAPGEYRPLRSEEVEALR